MATNSIALTRQTSITRRLYNALTYGMVALSFVVLGFMYDFTQSGGLERVFGTGLGVAALIAALVGSIGGIIVMGIGKSKQSVSLSAIGYTLFSLTFGVTMSLVLQRYDVGTITTAFSVTACLAGVFLVAGVAFPRVFSKMGGILVVGLIGLIAIEFVATVFFHVHQTLFDYVGIALFCGFIGYDSYLMAADEPTVPNALFYASSIYLDIINVLLRVLRVLGKE